MKDVVKAVRNQLKGPIRKKNRDEIKKEKKKVESRPRFRDHDDSHGNAAQGQGENEGVKRRKGGQRRNP